MRVKHKTLVRARELRQSLTDAEMILWSRLRSRRLMGWRFRRQHPIGPYIADFACIETKLVVELDGETHSSDEEGQHDARRSAFMEAEGWRIVRFWNRDVFDNLDGVLRSILTALHYSQ